MKRFLLILTLLSAFASLTAEDSLWVSSTDFSLYNEQGQSVAINEDAVKALALGWIVKTQEKPVLFHTPVGVIKLEAHSTLIAGDLSNTRPSYYLVDGMASFSTRKEFTGRITVSTTVSRYRATGKCGMFVATNQSEEYVELYEGTVQTVNGLTHRSGQLQAMYRLDQSTNTITSLEPEKLQSWQHSLKDIPNAPLFSGVTVSLFVPNQIKKIDSWRTPQAPRMPQVHVLSRVPLPVFQGSPIRKEANPAMPAVPKAPIVSFTKATEAEPTEESSPTIAPKEIAPPEAISHTLSYQETKPVQGQEKKIKKPARHTIGLSLSYEYDRCSDDFFTNENSQIGKNYQWLSIQPYFESKLFGLKLNFYYRTLDFQDWDNEWSTNVAHFATGDWMETTNSFMSLIESFHFGDEKSHLWISIGRNRLDGEGRILTGYHGIQPEWKNLSFGMRFGSVRINGSLDDVELNNLMKGREYTDWQYGNLSLSLVDNDLAFFSFGAIYGIHDGETATYQSTISANAKENNVVSYPYAEINIPFLPNKNHFQLNLLGSMATYLPVSPSINFDNIYDSDESSFENYMLSTGLSFGIKNLSIQWIAGIHKGFVNPYLHSPLVRMAGMNWLLYDSDMETRLQVTYSGKGFSFGASYTLPFDFGRDGKIACLDNSSTHADMLALGISAQISSFTVEAGYETFGLNDFSSIDEKEDTNTSFKLSIAYDYDFIHAEIGLKRNVSGRGINTSFGDDNPLMGYGVCTFHLSKGI